MLKTFRFMNHLVCLVMLSHTFWIKGPFFVIFEMEAKLSMGPAAEPTSHAPNLSSRR